MNEDTEKSRVILAVADMSGVGSTCAIGREDIEEKKGTRIFD